MALSLNCMLKVSTSAFSFIPSLKHSSANTNGLQRAVTPLFMSDDAPSDSSSDDTVEVDSVPFEPTQTEELVTGLMGEMPESITMDISQSARASISETILKLERLNPTESPCLSNLLNGVWSLKYSGGYASEWALPSPTRQIALFLYSGGYSPGIFGISLAQQLPSSLVEIGEVSISISREQPRVMAEVDVSTALSSSSGSTVAVTARLDLESDVRFTETYEKVSVLGREVELPSMVQYSRELFVTYLDDEILIVRDASGVPEILVRK